MAVTEGFSTHEDSTVELTGGDWNANMNKLERENEKKRMILNNQLNQTQNNIRQVLLRKIKIRESYSVRLPFVVSIIHKEDVRL